MRTHALVAGALIALAAIQPAAASAAPADTPAVPLTDTAAAGDFSVMQFATTDPEKLFVEWSKPTPGVQIEVATMMMRHQPIVTMIAFIGCTANAAGVCDVAVEFETVGPAGEVYARQTSKVWSQAPAPERNVLLSETGLGLRIEDKDPLGPYTVNATVTDRVAGKTLRTRQVLTATP